jgi:rhomboid family GlyGly-CTERM serine protease
MFVRAEFLAGAWWQLLTAQWVHVSWLHAAVNLVGLGVLLITFNGWVAKRVLAVALLGGYLGVAVVLALDAGCAWYAGASGALHGLLAGAALALVLDDHPGAKGGRLRYLGWSLLGGLALKLLWQHGLGDAPGWLGFATYTPAHEAGALGGLLAVLALHAVRRPRSAR